MRKHAWWNEWFGPHAVLVDDDVERCEECGFVMCRCADDGVEEGE